MPFWCEVAGNKTKQGQNFKKIQKYLPDKTRSPPFYKTLERVARARETGRRYLHLTFLNMMSAVWRMAFLALVLFAPASTAFHVPRAISFARPTTAARHPRQVVSLGRIATQTHDVSRAARCVGKSLALLSNVSHTLRWQGHIFSLSSYP